MAYGLAVTVTPYENLLKLANECAAGITAKDGSGFSRLLYHLVLKVLVDDFLPRHKDAKNDDSLRLLSLKLDTPRIGELLDAYQNDFVDAVSEPKGVTVDAKTRNAGIAAAKKFAGANFEKAVFTKSSWQTFKESKYPYRITAYALLSLSSPRKAASASCSIALSPSLPTVRTTSCRLVAIHVSIRSSRQDNG